MISSSSGRGLRIALLGTCLALLVLRCSTGFATAGTLDPASIHETVFPNGLRLLVKEGHAANLVAIQYWVRTGGFRETDQTRGAAHFIEHLIFKGTDRYPQGGIDQEIEDLGGVLQALTEKDWVMFGTTVASADAGKAIDVLGDALRHPKFRAEDLETERRVIAEEVAAEKLEPDRVVTAKLFAEAFPHHPYGHDVLGTPAAVAHMNRATVQQFFADQYTPSNATLIIVGDIEPATIVPHVRAAFGVDATPGSPVSAKLPPPDPWPAAAHETIRGDAQETYSGIAFPAPAVTDSDVYAMDVLVTLLEQGSFGRLPAALAGSTSSVKATFETRRQPGLITVVAASPPADAARVEAILRNVLRDLAAKGPTDAEVLATKSLLAGSYALDNETFEGQANSLGYYSSIDRWQFAAEYLNHVAQVTTAQVAAVARKYLDPEHAVSVTMQPQTERPPETPSRPGSVAGPSETRR